MLLSFFVNKCKFFANYYKLSQVLELNYVIYVVELYVPEFSNFMCFLMVETCSYFGGYRKISIYYGVAGLLERRFSSPGLSP